MKTIGHKKGFFFFYNLASNLIKENNNENG